MNIAGINAAANMSQPSATDTVGLAVLKKAIDINAQGAIQLIQAASNIVPSNPPHLGQRIDTKA